MDRPLPHILLVEDDADTRALIEQVLRDESYRVTSTTSLDAALRLVNTRVFDFVLTDTFRLSERDPLSSVEELLLLARPTPVGVMTAWNVSETDAKQRGFACLLLKPFELEAALTTLAACLNRPFTPEQEQQAEVIKRFFAAFEARDAEGCLTLCTEDITYYPPSTMNIPFERKVSGKASYRALLEEGLAYFGSVHYEGPLIFARPNGLAVRYSMHWTDTDGNAHQRAAPLLISFAGNRIARFGRRFTAPGNKAGS